MFGEEWKPWTTVRAHGFNVDIENDVTRYIGTAIPLKLHAKITNPILIMRHWLMRYFPTICPEASTPQEPQWVFIQECAKFSSDKKAFGFRLCPT